MMVADRPFGAWLNPDSVLLDLELAVSSHGKELSTKIKAPDTLNFFFTDYRSER